MSANVVVQVPVSLPYDELEPMGKGLIKAFKDGLCGLIDDYGHEVIPLVYDFTCLHDNGLVRVQKHEFFGVIDLSGKEVIPCIYDEILEGTNSLWAKKDGKFFLMDKNGALVIDDYFDDAWHEMCGASVVKKNGKWGVISTQSGETIVDIVYQRVFFSYSNLIMVQQEEKWGLRWSDGSEIFPPVYSTISFSSDFEQNVRCEGIGDSEYICVQKDQRWGIIRIYPR